MEEQINDIEPQNEDELFAEFVQKIHLPVPEIGDYYKSPIDGGRILFISAYGCAIRITRASRKLKEKHPNFLVPLFNRQAGSYIIEINPEIECPLPEEGLESVIEDFRKKGIRIGDSHKDNFDYIPGTKYPLLLDLDSMYVGISNPANDNDSDHNYGTRNESKNNRILNLLSENMRIMKHGLLALCGVDKNKASEKAETKNVASEDIVSPEDTMPEVEALKLDEINPQNEIYEPLIRILKDAWPEDKEEPEPSGIKKFWEACAQMKQQGRLVSPWEKEENNYRTTHSAATRYNEKFSCSSQKKRI